MGAFLVQNPVRGKLDRAHHLNIGDAASGSKGGTEVPREGGQTWPERGDRSGSGGGTKVAREARTHVT